MLKMPFSSEGASVSPRDGRIVIMQGLEEDLRRERSTVRDKMREIQELESQLKMQKGLVSSLELEALELRGENSRSKIRVNELERLCESQSHDVWTYKLRLEEALKENDKSQTTISSLKQVAAVSAGSNLDKTNAASDSRLVERLKHTEAMQRATNSIAELEAHSLRTGTQHAQEIAALHDQLRVLKGQCDTMQGRIARLGAASDAAEAAAEAALGAKRSAQGELERSIELLAAEKAKAAYAEKRLEEARTLVEALKNDSCRWKGMAKEAHSQLLLFKGGS